MLPRLRIHRFTIYISLTLCFLAATYLLLGHDDFTHTGSWRTPLYSNQGEEAAPKEKSTGKGAGSLASSTRSPAPKTASSPTAAPRPSKTELISIARNLLPSILDPTNTSFDRMTCPPINQTRYSYLKVDKRESKHKYFFALNLRQCVDLLPRLMGSVLEAIRFLGPQNCALSIVEGNSDDGTLEVLELLTDELGRLGTAYYLRRSTLNPSDGQRIEKLAQLRAMAVEPITGIAGDTGPAAEATAAAKKLDLADGATVLFINDVAACAEDLLELAHQRALQRADMTCAMDWTHPGGGGPPLFYDVWVARALNGDLFFDIPAGTAGWERAGDLFFNEATARSRLAAGRPFQVFACWNGAVAFAAGPVAAGEVRFRSSAGGECFQGEPQLFCKDMWFRGRGRIAVVPSVNLEYTDALGRLVKREKGYVSDWVAREGEPEPGAGDRPPMDISWQLEPPEKVKCMPEFKRQSWLPWNESLAR
ncbi:cryptococcal mannosyltransferase 1-domain-containing protein [Phialemonium atrogriseum]|uniref:Cryptococcal mannosyltransferase 1-domain-containing protein n=1 Tax=Phialemonium atrogriseum TaxID=1093897 RepID=A0AAJ0C7N4_9PEZI|nr:cryptococcal mannosyltransferase 1-domain-containing protein [Phialemonium atrogriseum]KAK1771668.1 cryptococcal mannosyltransferase 1-domain-containing protein [Phialemonium atrogriseum]